MGDLPNMADLIPQPLPERKKRNVFIDLRKLLSDINIRATRAAFQSANFLEGVTGWRMNANGLIEGTRLQLDNFVPYTDESFSFSGTWTDETVVVLYGGARKISSTIGDTFTITFRGTSIGLIMEKGATLGKISVSIDGGDATLVDLYDTKLTSREVVFQATGLAEREHILIATVATKNGSSSGNTVGIQGYVKSPTIGLRLEDISADLFAASFITATDGNGYAKMTSTGLPADKVAWGIMGFQLAEGDMADPVGTSTDPLPKLAHGTNVFYLYNGKASTNYTNTRIFLTSKIPS